MLQDFEFNCSLHKDFNDLDTTRAVSASNEAYAMQEAAIEFADYAFHNCDMWEAKSEWSVFVKNTETGVIKEFIITVEARPHFYATELSPT